MSDLPDGKDFGDYGQWPGRAVHDPTGRRLGEVREIYLDDATELPEWVLVELGETGLRYVPLAGATVDDDAIRVAHAGDQVEGAPSLEQQKELTQDEERRLYEHYGLRYSDEESDSLLPEPEQPTAQEAAPLAATPPAGDEPARPRPEAARPESPAEDATETDESATRPADAGPLPAASASAASRPRLRRYVGSVPELPAEGETSEPVDRGPMIPPRPEPVAPSPSAPPEPPGLLAKLRKPAPLAAGVASVAAIVFIVLRRRG